MSYPSIFWGKSLNSVSWKHVALWLIVFLILGSHMHLQAAILGSPRIKRYQAVTLWRERMWCFIWTWLVWSPSWPQGSCICFFKCVARLEDWGAVTTWKRQPLWLLVFRNEFIFWDNFTWMWFADISFSPRKACSSEGFSLFPDLHIHHSVHFRMCSLLQNEIDHNLVTPFPSIH